MEMRQLHHVLAIAEHRSIGAAARALNLTQPALTKSIRRLEQEFGVKLFDRLPRGVALTMFGESLVRHGKLMQTELREAQIEIDGLRSGHAGSIAVGAGPSWLSRFLPLAVSRLLASRPGVRVRVAGGFDAALMRLLRQGDLDLVIAALPDRPDRGIMLQPLTADDLKVFARADHPLAGRFGIGLAELQRQPWVMPGREVRSRHRLDLLFESQGLEPPEPVVETDSFSFMLETMRLTDCLGFCTSEAVAMEGARGLAPIDAPAAVWRRTAGVIRRSRGTLSGAAAALIKELEAICAEIERN